MPPGTYCSGREVAPWKIRSEFGAYDSVAGAHALTQSFQSCPDRTSRSQVWARSDKFLLTMGPSWLALKVGIRDGRGT